MGGIGFGVAIEPLGGSSDPKALYDALYDVFELNVERIARGAAYAQVTADYLHIAREDGAGYPKELSFGFRDGAGLCAMSMDACCHWCELIMAALRSPVKNGVSAFDAICASHGFRATKTKLTPLATLLARCDAPLIELRGNLFSTGKLDGKPYITSDDLGDDTLEWDDLTAKERAKVEAAMKKKKCACRVCIALRAKTPLRFPKPPKPPKRNPKTTLYDTHRNFSDDDCTEIPPEIFAPPNLRSINLRGGFTTLPKAILSLPALECVSLWHTKVAHIPDVLAKMTWLQELRVTESLLGTPAELAKIPSLRRISLNRNKAIGPNIEAFPFETFPELHELSLDGCDIAALPARISTLRGLRKLSLLDNKLTTLPDSFATLSKLERLELGCNALMTLPVAVGRLESLLRLGLSSSSELASIPENALPRNLENLDLASCDKLEALPESVGELRKLTYFSLSNTLVERLPDGLRNANKLVALQLDSNARMRELPSWLGELGALEDLYLDTLPVTSLPPSMRKLKKLKTLSIKRMSVFPLPDWLAELRALETLYVRREDLPRGEQARLKRLLPKKAKLDMRR